MSRMVLLHKNSLYRTNNFIFSGTFKNNSIYMGIDKLSFISYIETDFEYVDICKRLDFLCKQSLSNYKIEIIKDKHYKHSIKISELKNPDFYLVISYIFLHQRDNRGIRFELSPQYGEIDSIYNIIEWLKDLIGKNAISRLFVKSKVTRIDITADIHSKKFISNYYFSIPKSKKGVRFINNKDDCKNNYGVGSKRSEFYLLVYEKNKLYNHVKIDTLEDVIQVKEHDIEKRITRLELRIKPKSTFLLSSISELRNPFSNIDIYSKKYVESRFRDFLPFLEQERSLPKAIDSYLKSLNGSSRYLRYKINEALEQCKTRHSFFIDWTMWSNIVRILEPFNTKSQR